MPEALPYGFVRFGKAPVRRPPTAHHSFTGAAGLLKCRITALTPMLISKGGSADATFLRGNVIPGSSLKGLIRSVAEAAGDGCMVLSNAHGAKGFQQCSRQASLCVTCRTFGMMETSRNADVHLGHVRFGDVRAESVQEETLRLPSMWGPRPDDHPGYHDPDGGPSGRKFYFHHAIGPNTSQDFEITARAAQKGSTFHAEVAYSNLTREELSLLLYALFLEPGVHHKMGLGKPLGLGSIQIECVEWRFWQAADRYRGVTPDTLAGGEATAHIESMTSDYRSSQSDPHIDLRRILAWDPDDKTLYRYPNPYAN